MSVAELYLGGYSKGFWTTEGGKAARRFFADRGKNDRGAGVYRRDDQGRIVEARDFKDCEEALAKKRDLYCVTTDPWFIRCSWQGRTQDGTDVFVEIDAAVQPNLDETFWRVWEPTILATRATGGRVEETTVAARVSEEANLIVQQAISQRTYADLGGIAGVDYWRTYVFEETLGNLGLAYSEGGVAPARFTAPSVEKEKELRRRKEELEESLRREKLVLDYEAATTQIAEQKRQLEFATQIGDKQRQFQMAELERREALARKNHELEMFKIEMEIEGARVDRSRLDELATQVARSRDELADLQERTGEALDILKAFNESSLDMTTIDVMLKDIKSEIVDALGLTRDKRFYSRRFSDVKRKFNVECKHGSLTRDPVRQRPAWVARFDDPIKLEFRPPMDGYATVLNLGTSGRYWLLVPNGFDGEGVGPFEARVKSGERYAIPGDELYRDELYEGPPAGREEYVVIVTKEPLFEDRERFNAKDPEALVELEPERLTRVIDRLSEFDPDEFAVGTVSFTVRE